MSKRFAENTELPVSRTRAELEDLLGKYGATATAIFNSTNSAAVAFEMHGRRIMMKLTLPNPQAREFTHTKINQHAGEAPVSAESARSRHEKACRRKWRSLLLAVKAKLVAVEDGGGDVRGRLHGACRHAGWHDGRRSCSAPDRSGLPREDDGAAPAA